MVLLNDGINDIRDAHVAIMATVDFGTDGTAATATQTALVTPVVAASITPTVTKAAQAAQLTARMDASTATGYSYREKGVMHTTSTLGTRDTMPTIAHGTNDELIVIDTFFYKQG
jgi:hypothetical protein